MNQTCFIRAETEATVITRTIKDFKAEILLTARLRHPNVVMAIGTLEPTLTKIQ